MVICENRSHGDMWEQISWWYVRTDLMVICENRSHGDMWEQISWWYVRTDLMVICENRSHGDMWEQISWWYVRTDLMWYVRTDLMVICENRSRLLLSVFMTWTGYFLLTHTVHVSPEYFVNFRIFYRCSVMSRGSTLYYDTIQKCIGCGVFHY